MIKLPSDGDLLPSEELVVELRPWFAGVRFRPGLRPRGHEAVLGTAVAPRCAGDLPPLEQDAEGVRDPAPVLEREGKRRSGRRARGDVEVPTMSRVTPAGVNRLAQARREVTTFEPRNPHQAELRLLLLAILKHVFSPGGDRPHPTPPQQAATLERWWHVVGVYRRVLTSPEMASGRARSVLARLLAVPAARLTEPRLAYVLGRRKSKRPAKRGRNKRRRRGIA